MLQLLYLESEVIRKISSLDFMWKDLGSSLLSKTCYYLNLSGITDDHENNRYQLFVYLHATFLKIICYPTGELWKSEKWKWCEDSITTVWSNQLAWRFFIFIFIFAMKWSTPGQLDTIACASQKTLLLICSKKEWAKVTFPIWNQIESYTMSLCLWEVIRVLYSCWCNLFSKPRTATFLSTFKCTNPAFLHYNVHKMITDGEPDVSLPLSLFWEI